MPYRPPVKPGSTVILQLFCNNKDPYDLLEWDVRINIVQRLSFQYKSEKSALLILYNYIVICMIIVSSCNLVVTSHLERQNKNRIAK